MELAIGVIFKQVIKENKMKLKLDLPIIVLLCMSLVIDSHSSVALFLCLIAHWIMRHDTTGLALM